MAQTGFTPISLYYTATAAATPTAGNLVAGELAINTADGKLFYKDSSGVVQTLATKDTAAGTFTSITDSGNLTFTGTGNRIRGDFSNATVASRVAFQTSTTNGASRLLAIPNGTGNTSAFAALNSSDPNNASWTQISTSDTLSSIQATISGTGTYLPMLFLTGGAERLRIDTSGNVGIGASSITTKLQLAGTTSVAYTTTGSSLLPVTSEPILGFVSGGQGAYVGAANTGAGFGAHLVFGTATGAASYAERMRIDTSGNVGIGTVSPNLTSSNRALTINASTAAGLSALELASGGTLNCFLQTNNAGTYFGTGTATPLQFYTNSGERMRIDSSGNLLVNTTTIRNSAKMTLDYAGSSNNGISVNDTSSTNGSAFVSFYTGGTFRGYITNNNNTAVAYNTTSDYRLKENVAPMTGALATVNQLKPSTYVWKETGGAGQGFIAHELAEVCPDAVTGEKDAVDADGKPVYQGIDTSFLVATLTAAIQELKAEFDAYKATHP
jgi:hypothetical protein